MVARAQAAGVGADVAGRVVIPEDRLAGARVAPEREANLLARRQALGGARALAKGGGRHGADVRGRGFGVTVARKVATPANWAPFEEGVGSTPPDEPSGANTPWPSAASSALARGALSSLLVHMSGVPFMHSWVT